MVKLDVYRVNGFFPSPFENEFEGGFTVCMSVCVCVDVYECVCEYE